MKFIIKWALVLTICASSQSVAQQDMNKSPVAMAYVCWYLANNAGLDTDSSLFAKMIAVVRKMPNFKSEQHFEFMGYAAQQVHDLTSMEREGMYIYGCSEPLENIKRAEKQGMLD
ncbi:conserved exported hypothetical protein [Vibrio crassostreae]|uniref:hypothetical protein n=1 Tax=Vibrio crassostreae TaxID=246167 RepID=UPI0010642F63|nr:hypothetical protein [Vibrio crassostreae]TDW07879.1 hypothetical protein EDB45_11589 [Vibrio crassostreae]CAK1713744.1 conserved exported hypothetical protein [Vibrio crassostreae]CAK1734961.1 conserved exported hypothetical protein [Vibrio crassostreae]CAK1756146.1 conserved exported hypothetical protein [Vibrio crassostreae]CAK1783599.1 conserved exported hypothetical protein [Vibrio crassostreae]